MQVVRQQGVPARGPMGRVMSGGPPRFGTQGAPAAAIGPGFGAGSPAEQAFLRQSSLFGPQASGGAGIGPLLALIARQRGGWGGGFHGGFGGLSGAGTSLPGRSSIYGPDPSMRRAPLFNPYL